MEAFRQLPIPLAPVIEQRILTDVLAASLSVADHNERTLKSTKLHISRLRQSILKHAFEGKLIPQDPTDEPATALLARIRATRSAGTDGKKTPNVRSRPHTRRKVQSPRRRSTR